MSSLLPTVWPAADYRTDAACRIPPHVIVLGDPQAVEAMMPVFKHAYFSVMRNMASGIAPQQVINKRFDNGARMTVVSNHAQDTVYLYAQAGGKEVPSSAFLVTMADNSQRIYLFDFDSTEFDYIEIEDYFAGIRGIKVREVFVSWDGTGGGDLAHEEPPASLPIENYEPKPFSRLSGKLYGSGKAFPFVEGEIYGAGISGDSVLVAVMSGSKIQFHTGAIDFDEEDQVINNIAYGEAIGYVDLDGEPRTIVNFNSDLTRAVCGRLVITIPAAKDRGGATTLFGTAKIKLNPSDKVISAGFAPVEKSPDALRFTLMRETLKVVGGYVAPTNTYEYSNGISGWNDSPDSHVTSQKVDVTYKYFDLEYTEAMDLPTDPDRTGSVHKDMMATVIKKPIIVFNGIYPTTVYTWMRTITQEETSAENIFYWYRDYAADEFVRCNWSRGYFKTAQYDEYGAFEPEASNVLNSYANNVNKQKVFMGGLWFYTVANGEGDFILRKQPNNITSDALLVSKTGKTLTVQGTKAIAIF